MALPTSKPLHITRVSASVPAVVAAATNNVSLSAPFPGRVVQVGVNINQAVATADATCTTDVNGTAMTGGVITVTSAASAKGNSFTATPSALNTVNENDGIGFVFTGSGTAGGVVTVWADVRRGTL